MKKFYINSKKNTPISLKPSKVFRLLWMVVVVFGFNTAFAQTAGPNNAGAGTNINGLGVNWSNPTRIQADDTNYASVVLGNKQSSDYINGTNYNFSIPTTATIEGISVSIMRQSSSNAWGYSINDINVNLLKAGVNVGSNNATSADWPTTMGAENYGGATNLWGTTWTPADINDANFGVGLSVINQSSFDRTASVDYIQVTVYYKLVPTISSFTPTNGCSNSSSVVITGTNFTGATAVTFGGTNAASFAVNSATQITATLPASAATGTISVTTPGGTAISGTSFTVNATPSSPILGTITQPTCLVTTASVALSGLPSGSWLLTSSPGNITTTGSGTSTTISGLSSGTHTFSVIGTNNGTGLKGEYFNNMTLSGVPVLTRTDAMVNFNWADGNPGTPITNNSFSVKWSGQVQPLYTENYTFTTVSDDGIRLWVNGVQIINNWTNHAATNNTGTITLVAGVKYDIVLEYYENTGQAVSQLSWSSASQPFEPIPQSQLYPNASSCSSSASANVIINALPTTPAITPNKVDETCPSSNNGTISPVLSGGLTNVRYIKLTQKYTVDAYQQVAEIQAFEILTGTNVALSTIGAVATASSVWTGSTGPDFIASNVNNGVTTGNTFWHSATPNLNEWVLVDLQSGKNLDKITIYNRTDCCSTRGQNMLLELFDASNNLVYSKNVDLYQSGANVIDVNVLDVAWVDLATTLNRTALDSGTYTLNYADALGCSVNSPIVIGSTNTAPSTPIVDSITQPNCKTATGSVTLSSLPAGNWTINPGGITGNTASTTISGLAVNTYNFTVSNGTCTSLSSTNVVIQAATTATWNGSVWTNGPPTSNQPLEFTGNYTSTGDLAACSCTVYAGVDVVFKPLHTLTITNSVAILGTGAGAGTLTFESDLPSNPSNSASLVQINNAPNLNSGEIDYERYTNTAIRNTDYTYWSSPVAGYTLGGVSKNKTLSDKYYSYDSSIEDWKQESATSPMAIGVGYIIRGPEQSGIPVPPSRYLATFTGIPNNGHYALTGIIPNKSYLLGNPYPSALDADKFLDDNQNVLDGTLYFWTHNTALDLAGNITNPGPGWAFTYSLDDYASYNRTGGAGTAAAASPGANTSIPTGKIATGQGFFGSSKVAITGTNEIVFNNNMRVAGASGNNSQFFKTKNPNGKTTKAIEKHRVWLDLMNNEGAFKQTLIGYVTDATNDYDNRFDGESFDANEYLDFYSVNQDKNLVIQGRALPFDQNDTVPLGFRTTINGAFTIKIDQTDGLLTNQSVYIEDKLTNTIFDLKSGNYTFNTVPGTFNDRFVLRYVDKTLSVDEIIKEDGIVVLYSNNYKTLIIRNNVEHTTVNSVILFNMLGQKIANWDVKGREQTSIQIPIKQISSGIYVVKVKTTNGESTKKIIVN